MHPVELGRLSVRAVVERAGPTRPTWLLPDATPEAVERHRSWLAPSFLDDKGRFLQSIQSFVVQAPGLTLLVDTCVGNDKDRGGRQPFHMMHTAFLEDLAAAGFPPESIDVVLCTHLHVDHVGWNTRLDGGRWVPTFANARYMFGKTEYEHWRDHSETPDKVAVFNDSVKPIVDAGKAELIASDARLCDEITMIPTPGHSPGHTSILIQSDGEEGLLTGDVAHHPCQMAHLDWSSTADSDPVRSAATRRELFSRFVDRPVLVIGGHYDAGHIHREGDAFIFVALSLS